MKILFLTENFGNGPVTTLCEIANKIKKNYCDVSLLFLGNGESAKICKKTYIFDNIYVIESYRKDKLKNFENLILSVDKIVAVETTDVLVNLINMYKLDNIYLVDNIFWLWDFLEDELKLLKRYFVSTVIPVDENIKRIASKFTNIVKVGPIRDVNKFKNCINKRNLMINFGGAECNSSNRNTVFKYYLNVIKCLDALQLNFQQIYICGRKSLINELKKYKFKNKFTFKTLEHNEFKMLLYQCSHTICTPGMGNFNELSISNIKTMFLLPINYSQYYQYQYFKSLNLDFYFNNYGFDVDIEKYLEETVGVKKVLNYLKIYNKIFENTKYELCNEMRQFIADKTNDTRRFEFYNKIDKQALSTITKQIIEE